MNTDERGYFDALTERVLGAVLEVSNSLGAGFLEKIYQRALLHDLMPFTFRKRIEEIRNLAVEQSEQSDDIRQRRKWLADLDKLLAEARTTSDLVAVASDSTQNIQQRIVAIWALGRLQARTAIRPLLKVLKGPDAKARYYAANALCDIGDEQIIPGVLRIVEGSPNWQSREGAVWILHKITAPGVGQVLARSIVHDPVPAVRSAAAHSLISYPGKRTSAALAKALSDPSPVVRSVAIFAVSCLAGSSGVETAIPALRKLAHDNTMVPRHGCIAEDARDALYAIKAHMTERGKSARNEGRRRFINGAKRTNAGRGKPGCRRDVI